MMRKTLEDLGIIASSATARGILVTDLETGGHDPADPIVEIALALLDPETGKVYKLLDTPVNEHRPLTGQEYIFQESDLTTEDVAKGTSWPAVADLLALSLARFPLTSFNAAFDLPFLEARGISIPLKEQCIMLRARDHCKIPKHKGSSNEDNSPYKWPKLTEAWRHFFPSEPWGEVHRAWEDAEHAAKILHAMIQVEKGRQR